MAFHQSQLQQKTTNFAKLTIKFCKSIPASHLAKPIISQLIRSATSISANYTEANNASSKKIFAIKSSLPKKKPPKLGIGLPLFKNSLPIIIFANYQPSNKLPKNSSRFFKV